MNAETINATATVLAFDAATYAGEVQKLRDKTVAAHNAATPFARHALCGLLCGDMTEATVTHSLLAVYKPVSPTGKAGDKLSALRYAAGGDTARKAAEKVFAVYANRDADGVMPLIRAFVMAETGAPKSLEALHKGMNECLAKAAEAAAAAAAEMAGEPSEQPLDGEPTPASESAEGKALAAVDTLRAYLATGEASLAVVEKLGALFADWQALSAPATVEAIAA